MSGGENVCRTCLRSEDLTPIFTKADQRERFTVALFLTTGLQIEFDDGLPQTICSECRNFMKVVIDFRTQCHKAEQTLVQLGFSRTSTQTSDHMKMKEYYLWCTQNVEMQSPNGDKANSNNNPMNSIENCDLDLLGAGDIKIELNETEVKFDENWFRIIEPGDNSKRAKGRIEINVPIKEETAFPSNLRLSDTSDPNIASDFNTVEKPGLRWSDDSFDMETGIRRVQRERKRGPHLDRKKTYGHLLDQPMGVPGPYKCKACKKTLKNWDCFRSHAKIHAGLQFMCELCGRMFSTVTMLKRHYMSQHGAERTYRCGFCSYATWDAERLKIHVRRAHTKERPYVCDTCGAGFSNRSHIVHHLVVHLVEKNVQCPQCPSRFKNNQQLMSHRWHVHRKQRTTCDICHKSYTCRGNLREHQRKIHGVYQKGLLLRPPARKLKAELTQICGADDGSRRKSIEVPVLDVEVTGIDDWQYMQGAFGHL